MLIAEYWTDGPLLKEALERAPDVEISLEETYIADDTAHYLFWAEGGSFAAFEAGVDADSTVSERRTLAETSTRRLYRVAFSEGERETSMIPEIRNLDLVRLAATATHEGWTARMQFPDREALDAFRSAHHEQDFPFELRAVYHEVGPDEDVSTVTGAQREALVAAYEGGHFDVPQHASQRDVADRLGIAPQSLSERLRRGTAALVESALLPSDI